jgi:pullulanase/glycogen debranching enzyme
MLLMGDEIRRTQGGNNNAYCQDSEVSWFDWTLVDKHADIHRFCKVLIAMRKNRALPREGFDMTLNELLRQQPFRWHGVELDAPDWSYEAFACLYRPPIAWSSNAAAFDRKRLLGTARVPDAAAQPNAGSVATMYRHLSRSPTRCVQLGRRREPGGHNVQGWPTLDRYAARPPVGPYLP